MSFVDCAIVVLAVGTVAMSPHARGAPAAVADPSCRAPDRLAYVQAMRIRSEQSDRGAFPRLALAAEKPALFAEWDPTLEGARLRVVGPPGTTWRVMTSSRISGPWSTLRGILLSEHEQAWRIQNRSDAQFYTVAEAESREVGPLASNFRLIDLEGEARELFYYTHRNSIVVVAAGERLENVASWIGDLNALTSSAGATNSEVWVMLSDALTPRAQLKAQAAALGLRVPVLVDRDLLAARILGVGRAGEAVLIRAPDFVTVYRGPIREGEECFLCDALGALRDRRSPQVWQAGSDGAFLSTLAESSVRYSQDVAPILKSYCVRCHRPDGIAPFAFSAFAEAQSRTPALRHQILSGNMPPWHADPEYGQFTNSLALPNAAKQKLVAWLDAGAPRGDGPDPLTEPLEPMPAMDLTGELGPPDEVIRLEPQAVRATGPEPYRTFPVRTTNAENVWLRGVAMVPGDPSVVHHYTVYEPLPADWVGDINLGFGIYVPGRPAKAFPEGAGMYLGALSPLLFELHYTPKGREAIDVPALEFWYSHQPPTNRFLTFTLVNAEFKIPPGAPAHPVQAGHTFAREVTLHSLAPHMHFRGRSMRFELVHPDGGREILLSVPHYDFNWQLRYELVQPRVLPPGTTLEVTGTFDNSVQNLSNPDPSAEVSWGQQSWLEMFMGVLEITQARE